MKTGGSATTREYLEECVTSFEEDVAAFRESQPGLSCSCALSSSDRIMLQFKTKGSTISKPLKIEARARQSIKPFVDRLLATGNPLKVANYFSTDSVVTYYLARTLKPQSAAREAAAEARQ